MNHLLFLVDDTVEYRLKSAGAVLVAKLASGSLGYDDIWFGGRTRNPWNIEEFSTGSSAGPAACTSAGINLEPGASLSPVRFFVFFVFNSL